MSCSTLTAEQDIFYFTAINNLPGILPVTTPYHYPDPYPLFALRLFY